MENTQREQIKISSTILNILATLYYDSRAITWNLLTPIATYLDQNATLGPSSTKEVAADLIKIRQEIEEFQNKYGKDKKRSKLLFTSKGTYLSLGELVKIGRERHGSDFSKISKLYEDIIKRIEKNIQPINKQVESNFLTSVFNAAKILKNGKNVVYNLNFPKEEEIKDCWSDYYTQFDESFDQKDLNQYFHFYFDSTENADIIEETEKISTTEQYFATKKFNSFLDIYNRKTQKEMQKEIKKSRALYLVNKLMNLYNKTNSDKKRILLDEYIETLINAILVKTEEEIAKKVEFVDKSLYNLVRGKK